jgi:signal transduction histidine kinase
MNEPGMTLGLGFDQALALVDEAVVAASVPAEARVRGRDHAIALFDAAGAGTDAIPLAQLLYAGQVLSVVAVDLAAKPALARRVFELLESLAGVPRVALGLELIQSGRLLELPVNLGIEVRLALLRVLAGADSVALWSLRSEADLELISSTGEMAADTREGRDAARRLLASRDARVLTGAISGIRIERLRPPAAALVTHGGTWPSGSAELLLTASAPVLSALLDRESLLVRDQSTQEAVLSSVQRRLARLRYDLHDGPQQDVHLLAQDLNLFREQLRPMVAGNPDSDRVLGRLDDLEAQLVALDGDLRRLSSAVQSPLLAPGSLPDALRTVTDAFAARTGIEPEVAFAGDLSRLTDSQQIALLSLIRESLSNIRKHSQATHVSIRVSAGEQGVETEITDDGTGFDPETTLVRAARAGRLGLVGMHERVRMLGGRTQIDSRPGGPTVISATLPPWPAEPDT